MENTHYPTGELLRGTLAEGQVRVLFCNTTHMAEACRITHKSSSVCTAALGRSISAGVLLNAMTNKGAEHLTMTISGDGPAGKLVVVVKGQLVKAYIEHPEIEIPLKSNGKLDVSGVVGNNGLISVVRDFGFGHPYVGQSKLVSGEIAEDIAYYCSLSEQQPTLCSLGVRLISGKVMSSGGILIQPLPGCNEDTLSQLELRSPIFADISTHLLTESLESLFLSFFDGMKPELLEKSQMNYGCDCSRIKMERLLVTLGKEELQSLVREQHGAEIECDFCHTKHTFSEKELSELLQTLNSSRPDAEASKADSPEES